MGCWWRLLLGSDHRRTALLSDLVAGAMLGVSAGVLMEKALRHTPLAGPPDEVRFYFPD